MYPHRLHQNFDGDAYPSPGTSSSKPLIFHFSRKKKARNYMLQRSQTQSFSYDPLVSTSFSDLPIPSDAKRMFISRRNLTLLSWDEKAFAKGLVFRPHGWYGYMFECNIFIWYSYLGSADARVGEAWMELAGSRQLWFCGERCYQWTAQWTRRNSDSHMDWCPSCIRPQILWKFGQTVIGASNWYVEQGPKFGPCPTHRDRKSVV